MKKIGLWVLVLVMMLELLPSTGCSAAGGPSLQLARAEDTPGSRDVVVGTTGVVALKATLAAHYGDFNIDSIKVGFFKITIQNGILTGNASPAQPGDIANVRLNVEPNLRLTTSKNFDPGSNFVTFNGTDWLSPMIVTQNATRALSVVFDVPATCNASGLFASIEGQDVKINISSGGQTYQTYATGSANGTFMAINKSGFIEISLPSDTPQSAILAVGEMGVDNITFTKIDVFAGRESMAIQSLSVANMADSIRDTDIKTISIWDGNVQLGIKQVLVNSNETEFNFPPDSAWTIPADTHKILTIKADLNGVANGSISGDTVALALVPNKIKAVGLVSGEIISRPPNFIFGNTMILRKSKPYVAAASLPSIVITAGTKTLYRWTITADQQGDISWKDIEFDISGNSSGRTIDATGINQMKVWSMSSNTEVVGQITPIATPSGLNVVLEAYDGQTIAAGSTKTYELRGNILLTQGGDAISTKIKSKATGLISGNYTSLLNLPSSFVWTDGATWTTDYLVFGIPTATLSLVNSNAPTPKPSIAVLSPNGGEKWEMGKTYNINWQSSGFDKVVIFITDYTVSSELSKTIVTSTDASVGSYSWTVPQDFFTLSPNWKPKDNFKVFVGELKSNGTYGAQDESDNYFSIVTATIPVSVSQMIDMIVQNSVQAKDLLLQNKLSDAMNVIQQIQTIAEQLKSLIGTSPLRGDVNGDGKVDGLDITALERIIAGLN